MSTSRETAMDNRRGWYWDKGVNGIYLTALIAILLSLFGWARYVDNGQVQQNDKIEEHTKRIDTIEKNGREDQQRMSDKIDKIYEIVSKGNK